LNRGVIFVDIGSGIVDHHSMSIPPISTKITSHLNSLNDGQQFHQYQQKSPIFVDIGGIVDYHSMS
jgi:hypothetical protein